MLSLGETGHGLLACLKRHCALQDEMKTIQRFMAYCLALRERHPSAQVAVFKTLGIGELLWCRHQACTCLWGFQLTDASSAVSTVMHQLCHFMCGSAPVQG